MLKFSLLKPGLPKPNLLRFKTGHFPALLFIAVIAWFSCPVMAELAGDNMLAQASEAFTWPMLPGESLNQLAALFYPGNKPMQQRFVAKTQELSRRIKLCA